MGFLLVLLLVAVLVAASLLGYTADSREPRGWYPAGPDQPSYPARM
jgi:hypothetical protein